MLLTACSSDIAAGEYRGRFVGIEPITNNFGPAWRWRFIIDEGNLRGKEVCRITGDVPRAGTTCRAMMAAVAGRVIADGENIDERDYVNRPYSITLAPASTGKIRVETVRPLPSTVPQQTATAPHQTALPPVSPQLPTGWAAAGDVPPANYQATPVSVATGWPAPGGPAPENYQAAPIPGPTGGAAQTGPAPANYPGAPVPGPPPMPPNSPASWPTPGVVPPPPATSPLSPPPTGPWPSAV